MENDNQKIIAILEEQNQLLKILVEHQQKADKIANLKMIYSIISSALPFIIILIVGYYLYQILFDYINTLNNNVNTLKEGFLGMQSFLGKLVPDFNAIGEKIQTTWQSTNNLFN
jgi:hypothetical protein